MCAVSCASAHNLIDHYNLLDKLTLQSIIRPHIYIFRLLNDAKSPAPAMNCASALDSDVPSRFDDGNAAI